MEVSGQLHVPAMRLFRNIGSSLRTIPTNRNEVQHGNKRTNSGNVSHYSSRKVKIPSTFSKTQKLRIYNTILFFSRWGERLSGALSLGIKRPGHEADHSTPI
jgi:hypothetical protein